MTHAELLWAAAKARKHCHCFSEGLRQSRGSRLKWHTAVFTIASAGSGPSWRVHNTAEVGLRRWSTTLSLFNFPRHAHLVSLCLYQQLYQYSDMTWLFHLYWREHAWSWMQKFPLQSPAFFYCRVNMCISLFPLVTITQSLPFMPVLFSIVCFLAVDYKVWKIRRNISTK